MSDLITAAALARRRIERPHAPVRKVDTPMPLFAAMAEDGAA